MLSVPLTLEAQIWGQECVYTGEARAEVRGKLELCLEVACCYDGLKTLLVRLQIIRRQNRESGGLKD